MNTLSELLKKVDDLFVHKTREVRLATFDYSLARFPYGWTFNLINSWHKWLDAGLSTDFHVWQTPEAAVREFLEYVEKNDINVASLMEDETVIVRL